MTGLIELMVIIVSVGRHRYADIRRMTALCELRLRPQGDLDKTEMSLRSGRGLWIGFGAARIAVANRGGEEISRNGGFGQGMTALCAFLPSAASSSNDRNPPKARIHRSLSRAGRLTGRLSSFDLAGKLSTERRRQRVSVGLFRHFGMILEEPAEGAHNLAALQARRQAIDYLSSKQTAPREAA